MDPPKHSLPSLPSPSSKQWPPCQCRGVDEELKSAMNQLHLMFQMVHMPAHKPGATTVLAATFMGLRSPRNSPTSTWSVLVMPNGHKRSPLARVHLTRRLMAVACTSQGGPWESTPDACISVTIIVLRNCYLSTAFQLHKNCYSVSFLAVALISHQERRPRQASQRWFSCCAVTNNPQTSSLKSHKLLTSVPGRSESLK